MPGNSDIVICDTSCLILLGKIDEFDLLNKLSKKVLVTSAIKKEYGKILPEWIQQKAPADKHYQAILEMDLDKGEASAIALSLETENSILIIDDLKGRKIANKLDLRYSGTLGLILRAKEVGILNSIKPVLAKIERTNFRFSQELFEFLIKEAEE